MPVHRSIGIHSGNCRPLQKLGPHRLQIDRPRNDIDMYLGRYAGQIAYAAPGPGLKLLQHLWRVAHRISPESDHDAK